MDWFQINRRRTGQVFPKGQHLQAQIFLQQSTLCEVMTLLAPRFEKS